MHASMQEFLAVGRLRLAWLVTNWLYDSGVER
jgi:hypothetical protein